jgi:hypothetical protein
MQIRSRIHLLILLSKNYRKPLLQRYVVRILLMYLCLANYSHLITTNV